MMNYSTSRKRRIIYIFSQNYIKFLLESTVSSTSKYIRASNVASRIIQRFFRHVVEKIVKRKNAAATCIQVSYRSHVQKKLELEKVMILKATIICRAERKHQAMIRLKTIIAKNILKEKQSLLDEKDNEIIDSTNSSNTYKEARAVMVIQRFFFVPFGKQDTI